ncbi:hypothetical protein HanPI659440_Chr09g0319481 [Helianthus annuus]|nr:hypothetical protein HanPI659440_Chr09g0319481 [Helianthus annuus]
MIKQGYTYHYHLSRRTNERSSSYGTRIVREGGHLLYSHDIFDTLIKDE